MSDEVFEVSTSFGDVAELGQGYINRADGERILVPLANAPEVGEGVRFIVHLIDGTPAFAGAGRCVQVSDQGPEAGGERYETLLDSLAFDERSQPVYDYIVAVRQAVYAAGGPQAEAVAAEQAAADVQAAEEGALDAPGDSGEALIEEQAAYVASYEETVEAGVASDALEEPLGEPDAISGAQEALVASGSMPAPERLASVRPSRPAPPIAYVEEEPAPMLIDPAAYKLGPISRGMLQRAAVDVHWQPDAPQPPQASRKSGLFRYPVGTLPVPAAPPRPELDPTLRVKPAPSPTTSMRP
jgi:hypothetical protein